MEIKVATKEDVVRVAREIESVRPCSVIKALRRRGFELIQGKRGFVKLRTDSSSAIERVKEYLRELQIQFETIKLPLAEKILELERTLKKAMELYGEIKSSLLPRKPEKSIQLLKSGMRKYTRTRFPKELKRKIEDYILSLKGKEIYCAEVARQLFGDKEKREYDRYRLLVGRIIQKLVKEGKLKLVGEREFDITTPSGAKFKSARNIKIYSVVG